MNRYLIQEVITITAIAAGLVLFIIKSGIIQTSSHHSNPEGLIIVLVYIPSFMSVMMCLMLLFEKNMQTFYADRQFYSRDNVFGVIIKTVSKWLAFYFVIVKIIILVVSIVFIIITLSIVLLIISMLLVGMVGIITYIARLLYNHREAAAFIITMIITTISYFLYRNSFAEELMIWLVAFSTGSASSLIVWLAFNLNNGWLITRLTKAYHFLSNDDAYPEKIATYHLSRLGVMVFRPGNWFLKNAERELDRSSSFLLDTSMIKFR